MQEASCASLSVAMSTSAAVFAITAIAARVSRGFYSSLAPP